MKNRTSSTADKIVSKNFYSEKIKTTNVNILLNRVRSDRKKILKKKIFFSLFLVSIISMLAVFIIN